MDLKCFLILFLSFAALMVSAQETEPKIASSSSVLDSVYLDVDVPAEFVWEDGSLGSYLGSMMRYPAEALMRSASGTVFVGFVIQKDGALADFEVVGSCDPALDTEALRVVRAMPNWKPATIDGVPVASQKYLPVKFRMGMEGGKLHSEIQKKQRQKEKAERLKRKSEKRARKAANRKS